MFGLLCFSTHSQHPPPSEDGDSCVNCKEDNHFICDRDGWIILKRLSRGIIAFSFCYTTSAARRPRIVLRIQRRSAERLLLAGTSFDTINERTSVTNEPPDNIGGRRALRSFFGGKLCGEPSHDNLCCHVGTLVSKGSDNSERSVTIRVGGIYSFDNGPHVFVLAIGRYTNGYSFLLIVLGPRTISTDDIQFEGRNKYFSEIPHELRRTRDMMLKANLVTDGLVLHQYTAFCLQHRVLWENLTSATRSQVVAGAKLLKLKKVVPPSSPRAHSSNRGQVHPTPQLLTTMQSPRSRPTTPVPQGVSTTPVQSPRSRPTTPVPQGVSTTPVHSPRSRPTTPVPQGVSTTPVQTFQGVPVTSGPRGIRSNPPLPNSRPAAVNPFVDTEFLTPQPQMATTPPSIQHPTGPETSTNTLGMSSHPTPLLSFLLVSIPSLPDRVEHRRRGTGKR